jgi:aerobic carbon-monoxide dehydrogenase medium subunit
VKPPRFSYARPSSLAEAVRVLADEDADAKVLAGGQSLLPMLNMRIAQPSVLVDIALLPELQGLHRDGEMLAIGAGVRQRAAETSAIVHELCPILPQALRHVGHHQIRNRGTVGGSLAHADPSAELPAVAVALDAELVATSTRGQRVIPAREFFAGPLTTALGDDELLVQIRLPVCSGMRTAFTEVARRSGDFASAAVAAAVSTSNAALGEVRLAAVGVAGAPVRLTEAEAVCRGAQLDDAMIESAAAAARDQLARDSSAQTYGEYRRDLAGVLVARALKELRR